MRMKDWRQKLPIRSQIFVIIFVFSSIIFSVQFGMVIIGNQFITNALQNASEIIFSKETKQQMNNIWIYTHGMEELVEKTKQQISSVTKLNQHVNKVESFQIPRPRMCLLDPQDMDTFCFNNSICCGIFGKKVEENLLHENLMKMTSLLNEFRLEFDISIYSPILLIFKNEAQIHCHSHGFFYPSNFLPFDRPYYIEHQKQFQKSTNLQENFFTGPYIILKKIIRCSITASLLNENNELIGIGAKDLDFDNSLINKHYFNNFTRYIIALNGQVVYSEKYKIKSIPAFYLNESIYSGFNNDDYKQIMLQYLNQPFKGNCKEFQNTEMLCLFNSNLKENVIVQTSKIQGSPLIMVILFKIQGLKEEEGDHLQFLNQQIDSITKQLILISLFCIIAIIAIGQIITILILKQLHNIIQEIDHQIRKSNVNNFKTKHLITNLLKQRKHLTFISSFKGFVLIKSSTVSLLSQYFINLFNKSEKIKKSEECLFQENIQYQIHCKPMLRNMRLIKKLVFFLNRASNSFTCFQERLKLCTLRK